MHEVHLGYMIQDYLSGRDIEATTYEDIRQAIIKMLVEQKGYPRECLRPKAVISLNMDGKDYRYSVDLVAVSEQGSPLLALMFCAGEVETYTRQCLAAARLLPQGPARLAAVTDTTKALLLRVADGAQLEGMSYQALPDWKRLQDLAAEGPAYELDERKRAAEERIFFAFSELSCSCSNDSCTTGQ
jgi:hypothetical protein